MCSFSCLFLLSFGARVNVCAINCACKSIGVHELYMQCHCVPLNAKNPVWLAIGTDMSQDRTIDSKRFNNYTIVIVSDTYKTEERLA